MDVESGESIEQVSVRGRGELESERLTKRIRELIPETR